MIYCINNMLIVHMEMCSGVMACETVVWMSWDDVIIRVISAWMNQRWGVYQGGSNKEMHYGNFGGLTRTTDRNTKCARIDLYFRYTPLDGALC